MALHESSSHMETPGRDAWNTPWHAHIPRKIRAHLGTKGLSPSGHKTYFRGESGASKLYPASSLPITAPQPCL